MRVADVLQSGFHPSADSIRKLMPLAESYLEASYLRKPQWHTPLADRQDIFLERGRAHLFSGLLRFLVLADLARSESGVLPVSERVTASLDSAVFYLRKIQPYAEGAVLESARADEVLAQTVGDSLKAVLFQIKTTHSFYSALRLQPWRIIRGAASEAAGSHQKPANGGLSDAFYRMAQTARDPAPPDRLVWKAREN